jgi:hypothetical protein
MIYIWIYVEYISKVQPTELASGLNVKWTRKRKFTIIPRFFGSGTWVNNSTRGNMGKIEVDQYGGWGVSGRN